jgi:hypothetical protein
VVEEGPKTKVEMDRQLVGVEKLKYPEDRQPLFKEEMQDPVMTKPDDIIEDANRKEEIIWTASMKSYARRSEELKSNLITLYAMIWGQCSEAMRNKYAL